MAEEKLHKIYYNPSEGLVGAAALYKKAVESGLDVTMDDVREFLKKQKTYQITRPARVLKTNYYPIKVPRRLFQFQIDIAHIDKYEKQNKGIKYLLIIIDTYSRYLWVFPLKDKSSETTMDVLQELFKKVGVPENVNFDEGTEFLGPCEQYLKELDVTIWTANPDNHTRRNAIVERVIGTLRARIRNYMISNNTLKYIDKLDELVEGYNDTYHTGIGMTPKELWANPDAVPLKSRASKGENKPIDLGQTVRVRVEKGIFDKSDVPSYSDEVYTVIERSGKGYILERGGEKLRRGRRVGVWMPYEMQPATGEEGKTAVKMAVVKKDKRVKRVLAAEGIDQANVVRNYNLRSRRR